MNVDSLFFREKSFTAQRRGLLFSTNASDSAFVGPTTKQQNKRQTKQARQNEIILATIGLRTLASSVTSDPLGVLAGEHQTGRPLLHKLSPITAGSQEIRQLSQTVPLGSWS